MFWVFILTSPLTYYAMIKCMHRKWVWCEECFLMVSMFVVFVKIDDLTRKKSIYVNSHYQRANWNNYISFCSIFFAPIREIDVFYISKSDSVIYQAWLGAPSSNSGSVFSFISRLLIITWMEGSLGQVISSFNVSLFIPTNKRDILCISQPIVSLAPNRFWRTFSSLLT